MMQEVYILSGSRTPLGSFNGALSTVPGPRLGAVAIRDAIKKAGIPDEAVNEVMMGCVLSGGVGQSPARQATLFSGLPEGVAVSTLNKVCGSGLRTVMMAASTIKAEDAEVVVAGGMENMTMAPYALPKARAGMRMGNAEVVDLMVHDGLWDPYKDYHMGVAAELCASEMNITREDQDNFAIASYEKALASIEAGEFKKEIVPVEVPGRKGKVTIVDTDEEPFRAKLDKIPSLRPAFKKDGTVTAANASSINDGGSAVVVASGRAVKELGATPKFRIVGYASHSQAPEWFTTAPAYAIKKVWEKTGLTEKDIDVYEINEAFAVVSLAVNQIAGIPPEKVNLRGGAIALGHPIGASGNRIFVTLMQIMEDKGLKRGLASLCIGGGEAVAVIIERV